MAEPTKALVERNIRTLGQIGGVYDLLAVQVWMDHQYLGLDDLSSYGVELVLSSTPTHDTPT